MAERLSNWKKRLISYLTKVHQLPFEYGTHDCILFAAGGVEAMTGVDPAAELRGTYTTLMGGLKKAKAAGYDDHIEMVAGIYEECPVLMANAGDLAAVDGGSGISLGIVQGANVYCIGYGGMFLVPLTQAIRAFRI